MEIAPILDLLTLANLLHFQVKTILLATRALGLLTVFLFYIADLVSMSVLFQSLHQWKNMDTLYRNFSCLVILFALITICAGFIELRRTQF